ncbi:uncharacterized protein M421DRAFT_189878 [Didymella exigua CBS 183.55]|uniref:Uncharacterized protein n=1 Tax=Didymella exigua CBS 183.55 TaxID=1150837 RepID=A0A6A5RL08_9PLEO|nr:uncharacterized protein M421DRAFT_189878 [Didymella exigua CBS 183.55]KAF1927056.1 hypothetical protein M421DRAFT_189878 [Didymella exigua CBS 183.55]
MPSTSLPRSQSSNVRSTCYTQPLLVPSVFHLCQVKATTTDCFYAMSSAAQHVHNYQFIFTSPVPPPVLLFAACAPSPYALLQAVKIRRHLESCHDTSSSTHSFLTTLS